MHTLLPTSLLHHSPNLPVASRPPNQSTNHSIIQSPMAKRVLIITYYWPPAGGSGVQRWLKFTKYLRDFGWEPVIFTALNPEAPAHDNALLNEVPSGIEVIRKSVWEPYSIFKKITGRKGQQFGAGLASAGTSKRSWLNSLAIWIRGNFFIPDARMFWICPSVRVLKRYLKKNPVDVIVSTGPPHSTHLIAKKVSQSLNIPWLADFRDPWTNIDFFLDLKPSTLAKSIHQHLEKSVLSSATKVVTVTNGWATDLELLGGRKVEVIENGFDDADFTAEGIALDQKFTLTHIGTLSPNRNCNALWLALGRFVKINDEFAKHFKLVFVGSVDASAIEAIEANGLTPYCDFLGYLPHSEAVRIQQQSQALLLLVNNSPNALGIQTGKVFEYMAAHRPIFAVGPMGGDTQSLIDSTNSGFFVDFSDADLIEERIEELWNWYLKGWDGFSSSGIDRYSRRELTRQMAILLNDLV
jgi:glycosyltransferase involved in cell wall biosynthesis